jgi:hypothetical protein
VRQLSRRTAFAAVLVPVLLGASVTASAVRAQDSLPRAANDVKEALADAENIGLCLQDAQGDLFASKTFTPTPTSMEAARQRLTRCRLPDFAASVQALSVPAAPPVQPGRSARARTQLAESIRLLEQAAADARTAFVAAAAPEVDAEFLIIAYRSFNTARLRAEQLYTRAAAVLTPVEDSVPPAPVIDDSAPGR